MFLTDRKSIRPVKVKCCSKNFQKFIFGAFGPSWSNYKKTGQLNKNHKHSCTQMHNCTYLKMCYFSLNSNTFQSVFCYYCDEEFTIVAKLLASQNSFAKSYYQVPVISNSEFSTEMDNCRYILDTDEYYF